MIERFCENSELPKTTAYFHKRFCYRQKLYFITLRFVGSLRATDIIWILIFSSFKGAPSGLRPFLASESPLKMMKNAFYFTSKALFVLKIFKFLSWLFGHVAKRLDEKNKVNFKFSGVTAWLTINFETRIAQYL